LPLRIILTFIESRSSAQIPTKIHQEAFADNYLLAGKSPSPNQDGISSSENARQNGKDGVRAEMDSGTRNRPAAYVEFRASKETQP
jgi:hypothetical protein